MSWLISRKKWMTLSEAATYLSQRTQEEFTEMDILILGATGEIKISAYFTKPFRAKCVTVNTPMLGLQTLQLRREAEVFVPDIAAPFDLVIDYPMASIQVTSDGELENAVSDQLMFKVYPNSGSKVFFFPYKKLPDSAQWVLRTEVLLGLEAEINGSQNQPNQPEKPLHSSERKSIYQIIATLAAMAEVDLSKPYAADTVLRAAAAQYGLQMPNSSETVVKFLSEAAAFKDKS